MANQQSSQPSQSQSKRNAALVAAIAALLAMQAGPAPTATPIAELLKLPVEVVLPIVKLAMSKPWSYNVISIVPTTGPTATGQASDAEGLFRAAYIMQASRRWQQGIREGLTREELQAREDRWFKQHLDAQRNRRRVAASVDLLASRYGPELGWYATLDRRTSPECRAANGKNFNVAQRPPIGYPGSVHLYCRCKPGKPHAGSGTVYDIKPTRRAA